jgi:hypothetical protein
MAATRKRLAPKGVRKDTARGRVPHVEVLMVGELPARRLTNRTTRYRDAMAEVRKKAKGKGGGGWARIATFDSPNGAAAVRRALLKGERPIDGKVSDWEIESRRTRDNAGELAGSELYVRLKGGR